MNDEVLNVIQKCLEGNDEAWNMLHHDFAAIAQAFLRWKFPSIIDDHDDIIQKVFTNLLAFGLKNFKGTSKYEFLTYFKTIVRNEALRCVEDQKRRKTSPLHGVQADSESAPVALEIPDPDASARPDRIAAASEMVTLIAKTLKGCTLIDQEVYLLKLQGYMDKEISAILDIPMGTVAVKFSRVKNKLRGKFESGSQGK